MRDGNSIGRRSTEWDWGGGGGLEKMGAERSERRAEGEAQRGRFNWEQSKAEQGSQTAADVREQEGSGAKDEKQGNT